MRALLLSALLLPLGALAAPAEVLQQLDALYALRDDSSKLSELDAQTAEALAQNPNDYAVLWRAARLKVWQGGVLPNGDVKRTYGKDAWNLGDRAVRQNPNGI